MQQSRGNQRNLRFQAVKNAELFDSHQIHQKV